MAYTFRPAVRSNVNLLIGLAGASGAGKTYTAMRLASGMSEGKKFAVLDTENGRASHYADQFQFDVAEMREPFTPAAYAGGDQGGGRRRLSGDRRGLRESRIRGRGRRPRYAGG